MGAAHSSSEADDDNDDDNNNNYDSDTLKVVPSLPTRATHSGYRVLALEGDVGCCFARIHGPMQRTLPRLSDAGVLEFATRTLLRLNNITVARNAVASCDRDCAMVGPLDYFDNMERPDAVTFTISLPTVADPPHARFPKIESHPLLAEVASSRPLRPVTAADVVRVKALWISGRRHGDAIEQLKKSYASEHGIVHVFGNSLFPNPGVLELELDDAAIDFPVCDATELDLSQFGCRIVDNSEPFRFTTAPIDPKDFPRPVTYNFAKRYGRSCVEHGAGLFLETHDFTQSMTAANPDSCGFIKIARWLDGGPAAGATSPTPGVLEIVALRIPHGYTIIIDANCIHGDSTFVGLWLMAMSTDHVTMASADTVFLKHARTKQNVDCRCAAHDVAPPSLVPNAAPVTEGWVVFRDATKEELTSFAEATRGASFVLQPFSKLSWTTTIFRRFGVRL
jgi:hypothetical protein